MSMKKLIAGALLPVLFLGLLVPAAMADSSKEEVYAIVEGIYQQYQGRHDLQILVAGSDEAAADEDGPAPLAFTCETGEPLTILSNIELQLPQATSFSKKTKDIFALFSELYNAAQSVTDTVDTLTPFDADKFDNLYGGKVSLRLLAEDWWQEGQIGESRLLVGPAAIVDRHNEVIDDTIYSLCIFYEPTLTRIWLLSDADLVRDLFTSIDSGKKQSTTLSKYVTQWLTDMEDYTYAVDAQGNPSVPPRGPLAAAAKQAATQAWIESLDTIGTITIAHTGGVNLRADDNTDSAILGKAQPGDTFECVAITDSGWYQVIDGLRTVFVSQKMAEFTPQY